MGQKLNCAPWLAKSKFDQTSQNGKTWLVDESHMASRAREIVGFAGSGPIFES